MKFSVCILALAVSATSARTISESNYKDNNIIGDIFSNIKMFKKGVLSFFTQQIKQDQNQFPRPVITSNHNAHNIRTFKPVSQ